MEMTSLNLNLHFLLYQEIILLKLKNIKEETYIQEARWP